LPGLIYGENHAYSHPLTGSGYEATVSQIKREDLAKYHQTWFKPDHSTLIIVGDVTMKEVKPEVEKVFKNWMPGNVPKKISLKFHSGSSRPFISLTDQKLLSQ